MSPPTLSAADRKRLVALARDELPEPRDPRLLMDDLLEAGLGGPEALEVLSRTTLAWRQLRDMRLERVWQSGFGWFLARSVLIVAFGILLLVTVSPGLGAIVNGLLLGIGIYYLVVTTTAPFRLRRHKHRRTGILAAYADDLGEYLGELAQPSSDAPEV